MSECSLGIYFANFAIWFYLAKFLQTMKNSLKPVLVVGIVRNFDILVSLLPSHKLNLHMNTFFEHTFLDLIGRKKILRTFLILIQY